MRTVWTLDREILNRLYFDEKKTLAEIGSQYGVSTLTVMRAFDKLGIQRRSKKNAMTKRGSNNGNWKGSSASYSAMHKRIYKILGKADHCEACKRTDNETVYNWANLTGKLDDPEDYASLCKKCHTNLDDPNKNRRTDPCKKQESNILRTQVIQSLCDARNVQMDALIVGI